MRRTGLEQAREILRNYQLQEKREKRVDDFYEQWGRIVEQYPISSPRRR